MWLGFQQSNKESSEGTPLGCSKNTPVRVYTRYSQESDSLTGIAPPDRSYCHLTTTSGHPHRSAPAPPLPPVRFPSPSVSGIPPCRPAVGCRLVVAFAAGCDLAHVPQLMRDDFRQLPEKYALHGELNALPTTPGERQGSRLRELANDLDAWRVRRRAGCRSWTYRRIKVPGSAPPPGASLVWGKKTSRTK